MIDQHETAESGRRAARTELSAANSAAESGRRRLRSTVRGRRLDHAQRLEQAQQRLDLVLLVRLGRQRHGIGVIAEGRRSRRSKPIRTGGVGQAGQHGQPPVEAALGGDDPIDSPGAARAFFSRACQRIPARFEHDDLVDRRAGLRDGRARRIAGHGEMRLRKMPAQRVQKRQRVDHVAHPIAADDQDAGIGGSRRGWCGAA